MLSIETSGQFRRDLKKAKKQRKNLQKFQDVLQLLVRETQLPEKYKDHPLSGNWQGYRDCHVENDWVLIYKIDRKRSALLLQRIGSHAELFG